MHTIDSSTSISVFNVVHLSLQTREELEQERAQQERVAKQEEEARAQDKTSSTSASGGQSSGSRRSDDHEDGKNSSVSSEDLKDGKGSSRSSGSSPNKTTRISGGIQALMSKLNLSRPDVLDNKEDSVCPFDIDLYCNSNTGL